jgi:hypothetical protein
MARADPLDDLRLAPGDLFRSVNERIRELDDGWRASDYEFVCECADEHCFASLGIDRDEFDRIAARPGMYVVAPGHEQPDVDEIVERHEQYMLVARRRD